MLVGDVNSLVASFMVDADGAVLAFANAFPNELCEIYRLCSEKRENQAMQRLNPLIRLAKVTVGKFGIPGLKALMEMMDYRPGEPRMPFSTVNAKQSHEIRNALDQYAAKTGSPD